MTEKDNLKVKSVIELESDIELYRLVDFLNKNLKEKEIIFGLTQNGSKMSITIYET